MKALLISSFRLSIRLFIDFGLLVSIGVFAAVDPVDFSEFGDTAQEEMHQRYRNLVTELRCPKCQNQSIGASDAPIAVDMRQKVEKMMKEGQTSDEIKAFMVDRYGNFVTYSPPLEPSNYGLWFGPLVFFLLLMLGFYFKRPRLNDAADQQPSQRGKDL